jgi:hypothetical protein
MQAFRNELDADSLVGHLHLRECLLVPANELDGGPEAACGKQSSLCDVRSGVQDTVTHDDG